MEGKVDKIGLEVPLCNYVASDKIWRDNCIKEASAAKAWSKNWSFLTLTPRELLKDELHELIDPNRKPIEIPQYLKVAEAVPISAYIKVEPSPKPIPQTTSRMIGWRSGLPQYKLDKYEVAKRPQGSLLKRFNWPIEALY
uniref:Helicase ATP-binding domain-containing protein n=1 Tax=Schistosoma mansoni TaxID=6183 RepID=A0A5K4F780_SCHMA